MGTNYYHRYNACDCCGRYDERHICKSMLSFQGYRPAPDWPEDFTGPEVVSWKQWRSVIEASGEVWDEYGRKWDPAEFTAAVEATDPASRRRHYDWMVEHGMPLSRDWLDSDGFSFTTVDFS